MGNMLSRKELLTKDNLQVEKVEFTDGSYVFVREMYGRERDRFEQSLVMEVKDNKGNVSYERSLEDFRAKLAVNTVCDQNGNNLLGPDDVAKLSTSMSASKLEKIISVAQRLNKISDEDKENMVKNSGGDPVDDSTSG